MSSPLARVMVSHFRNSFDSTPIADLNLQFALHCISSGSYELAVKRVRHVLARHGKLAYDRAKARLEAFTFGGTFSPSRAKANLAQHSRIVLGDLDHLDARNLLVIKRALCGDPRTACVFISPSATGLKLGVHVPQVADDAGYKHAWQVVSKEYAALYGVPWDISGKDVSRLCFVSHDPDLYWNPDAAVFEVPPLPTPEPPLPPRAATYHPTRDRYDYAARAIKTAVEMIESAPVGIRHHTRLRAARLLGGYVAGGLLSEAHVYGTLAQALVGHTKDLERALKTVEDGLAYGKAHPITLDTLEVERQVRLDQQFARNRLNPMNRDGQGAPERPPSDPRKGRQTLSVRRYTGYTGYRPYRGYSQEGTRG
jgi:hypothetical protein